MQSYQIISGFSDIKSELRRTTRTAKTMSELRLWFSLQNDVLYVHDYHDQKSCLAIAIKENDGWHVRLDPKTFGYRLISQSLQEKNSTDMLRGLRKLYELHGTYLT